jgi:ZIP family zinc transporter
MDTTRPPQAQPRTTGGPGRTLVLFTIPVILLVGVIALFLVTKGAGLNVEPAAPVEALQFERTILQHGVIELHVRNTSPQKITLAQFKINDALFPFIASPSKTLARMGRAVITVQYPWTQAAAYEITLFSSSSIPFKTTIPVAAETKTASAATLWSFTLIGLYVGVIPVFLGMFWLPALRQLGAQWFMFLMAITAGLLIYLGIDAGSEALEVARDLGGPFQGVGLVGIGIVATFMLLDAIARRQSGVRRSEAAQRAALAFLIALGIGLHNLGEGLAIGAAYSVGAAVLGTFLVIGFIIQNLTEGLGIIAPILKDKPSLSNLALMGALGGGPAIVGGWIGGLSYSKPLAVVFLAVGAGAVFEVAYEISKLIQKDAAKRPMPLMIFAGVTVGMLALYVTGLLVK